MIQALCPVLQRHFEGFLWSAILAFFSVGWFVVFVSVFLLGQRRIMGILVGPTGIRWNLCWANGKSWLLLLGRREFLGILAGPTGMSGNSCRANGDLTYPNGDLTYTNGHLTYTNGDLTYTKGDLTYTNGDLTYTNGNSWEFLLGQRECLGILVGPTEI